MRQKDEEDEEDIIIVGGGIAGLATALALHRKGIKSRVIERGDEIRASGVNITIYSNGWRALHQLGVASLLRSTALPILSWREVSLDDHQEKCTPTGKEEVRCLRRRDLVETMANELPPGTIHFGQQVLGIELDPSNSYPMLHLHDGTVIKAKMVIGCDGVNSSVGKYLGLKPAVLSSYGSVRGFTTYEEGHGLDNEFVEMRKGNVAMGRAPISEKLVCWFVARLWVSQDVVISKSTRLIQASTLKAVEDFPSDMIQTVERCDIESLSLARLKQRSIMEVMLHSFRKGNVTVAGDAMHVMGPYFGQGGASALEDAIVLGRCVARAMRVEVGIEKRSQRMLTWNRVRNALDQYVKERRPRLLSLALRAHVIGRLIDPATTLLVRVICVLLMILVFRDLHGHARYDCGSL